MIKKYVIGLFGFLILLLSTLTLKYPDYRFQLYQMSMLEGYSYQAKGEHMQVSHYYSGPQQDCGGATLIVDSKESTLVANVSYDDRTTVTHQLTKQEDGSYQMDSVKKQKSDAKPKKIELFNSQNERIDRATWRVMDDKLYEASSQDYVFMDTYINAGGIFMGNFSCNDREYLKQNYQQVTIEFCYPDKTKTSGYELIARKQMSVDALLSGQFLGYIPFLPNGSFKENQVVHVIFAFEGEHPKTMVLELEEVNYGH